MLAIRFTIETLSFKISLRTFAWDGNILMKLVFSVRLSMVLRAFRILIKCLFWASVLFMIPSLSLENLRFQALVFIL
jgi:hypothetical protein